MAATARRRTPAHPQAGSQGRWQHRHATAAANLRHCAADREAQPKPGPYRRLARDVHLRRETCVRVHHPYGSPDRTTEHQSGFRHSVCPLRRPPHHAPRHPPHLRLTPCRARRAPAHRDGHPSPQPDRTHDGDLHAGSRQGDRDALRRLSTGSTTTRTRATGPPVIQLARPRCCTSLLSRYAKGGPRQNQPSDLGALGGTRTPNLLIRSQMLYPLSYERWCPASLRHAECALCQPSQIQPRRMRCRPYTSDRALIQSADWASRVDSPTARICEGWRLVPAGIGPCG